ncbi:putative alpha-galactosidase A [Pseudocercospora fuligena]|uniref:Alpha-galactosidase n=1 Tax=Pseudocercospora fuligena TaxID=685502 RepID=A0A8H6VN70_9PEZI|nr:putative alpha-galactosidase A [Pseudocercospora fuligena]
MATASLENPDILPTPPMGFNNWARFECNLNQSLFTETADAMVSKGLLAAGYNRVNIDDCWPLYDRAPNGSLQWNETLFADGLIWLGRYLKKKGFHFGIYSDAGNETCGGYPGSVGYEELDAKTFADWGIDYLKLDGCNVYNKTGQTLQERYEEIYGHWHDIFSKSDRPLIFSESAPAYFAGPPLDVGSANLTDWFTVMNWVPQKGELSRHSQDIIVHRLSKTPWTSVMANYDQEVRVAREQRKGYYNDPDFLIADDPHLTLDEKKSHFALWASFSAPLIISAYIPDLPSETIRYLTNKDLIAVNQDSLGLQATLVSHDGTWDVLTRSLSNGDRLLTILNNGSDTASIEVPINRLGWSMGAQYAKFGISGKLEVKDLWTGKSSTISPAEHGASIQANVPSHGTAVYRISVHDGPRMWPRVTPRKWNWIPTGLLFNAASFHCLTVIMNGTVIFAKCDGSVEQIWQVGQKGAWIKSLDKPGCLTVENGHVVLGECNEKEWIYSRYGLIQEESSRKCLTEGKDGDVMVEECGYLRNDQVWEMPSGWQL